MDLLFILSYMEYFVEQFTDVMQGLKTLMRASLDSDFFLGEYIWNKLLWAAFWCSLHIMIIFSLS